MITLTEARLRFGRRYLALLVDLMGDIDRGGRRVANVLEGFDLDWPNIEAAQAWASGEAERNRDAAVLSEGYATAGNALMVFRRRPEEQARWARSGLLAAQRLSMKPVHQAKHLFNLAIAHSRLGDQEEAIRVTMEAFQLLQQTDGPIDPYSLALGHARSRIQGSESRRSSFFHDL